MPLEVDVIVNADMANTAARPKHAPTQGADFGGELVSVVSRASLLVDSVKVVVSQRPTTELRATRRRVHRPQPTLRGRFGALRTTTAGATARAALASSTVAAHTASAIVAATAVTAAAYATSADTTSPTCSARRDG